MKNLLKFQSESPWPAAQHWPLLVFLHRNVWTLSALVPVFISNERNHSVFGAIDNKTAQTANISGDHSYRTNINIPIVSVCWRYRLLHGTIPIVETLNNLYVFVSRRKKQHLNTKLKYGVANGMMTIEFCLFSVMANYFVVFCFFLITSALGPTVWYLWIYCNSANANFYFGATLAFASAQVSQSLITKLTDEQGISFIPIPIHFQSISFTDIPGDRSTVRIKQKRLLLASWSKSIESINSRIIVA